MRRFIREVLYYLTKYLVSTRNRVKVCMQRIIVMIIIIIAMMKMIKKKKIIKKLKKRE